MRTILLVAATLIPAVFGVGQDGRAVILPRQGPGRQGPPGQGPQNPRPGGPGPPPPGQPPGRPPRPPPPQPPPPLPPLIGPPLPGPLPPRPSPPRPSPSSSTRPSSSSTRPSSSSTRPSSSSIPPSSSSIRSSSSSVITSSASSSRVSTTSSATSSMSSDTSMYAWLDEQCGPSVNKKAAPGKTANSGLCCSSAGYAGFTDDHCGDGCQPNWGRCGRSIATVRDSCTQPGSFTLTFDDGPSVLTQGLLNYLKSQNVKATFFINGLNWKNTDTRNPLPGLYNLAAIVRSAFNNGHQICSHTWSHTDLITVGQYNITYELTRLNNAFRQILPGGVVPTCFRPPYGDTDNNSLAILQGLGYGTDSGGAIVAWDLDPVDWNPAIHGDTPQAQIDDMVKEFQNDLGTTKPADSTFITLNHDVWNTTADFRTPAQGGNYPNVVPLAQRVVELLKPAGWKFVTLDECMGKPAGSFYRPSNPNDYVCGDPDKLANDPNACFD